MNNLTLQRIAAALHALGLQPGDTLFVHSSLSSMGHVNGGAKAVADAFLDVIGPKGTLVVPTFTFSHAVEVTPVFDPEQDVSEMGRITEVVRTRSSVRRSIHLLHSIAALGPLAEEITATHGPSAWAGDGPFWRLYELNARILLLGVPYLRCTQFHVVEQMAVAPYRGWEDIEARVRDSDGTKRPLRTRVFKPMPGFAGNDFNKFGALLEAKSLVQVGSVGNAITRLFQVRDVIDFGLAEYRKNPLLFVKTGEGLTQLRDGIMTDELDNEKSVLYPAHRVVPPHSPSKS